MRFEVRINQIETRIAYVDEPDIGAVHNRVQYYIHDLWDEGIYHNSDEWVDSIEEVR